jgi:hypothetical protein
LLVQQAWRSVLTPERFAKIRNTGHQKLLTPRVTLVAVAKQSCDVFVSQNNPNPQMREQGTFIFATDAVSYRNINATDSTNVHSVRSVSFSTAFFDLALGPQGDSTALTSYKLAY